VEEMGSRWKENDAEEARDPISGGGGAFNLESGKKWFEGRAVEF
jgi:hypothetical protein